MTKVLEFAKHNELERLQWKAEYLRNEIFVLQDQKTKTINHISKLNKMNMYVHWLQEKVQVGYMNQEPRISQLPINYNAERNFMYYSC